MISTEGSLSRAAEGGRLGKKSQLEASGEARLSCTAGASLPLVVGGRAGGTGINSGPVGGEERFGGAGTPSGVLPLGVSGWFSAAASESVRGEKTGCVGTGWNREWL